MAYVYRHIRLDKNEPFYIGIGSDKYYKRAKNKTARNPIWQKIANKTFYEVEILFDNITTDEAKKKEIEFINLYGRLNDGSGTLANITGGGEGMYNPPKEYREKLSKRMSGSNNPYYGKKHSPEIRKKISENQKGVPRQKHFQSTKEKIGKANKGKKPWCYGKKDLKGALRRSGVNHHSYKGEILVYNKELELVHTFLCIKDAANFFNMKSTNSIRTIIKGERQHYKGYIFRYTNQPFPQKPKIREIREASNKEVINLETGIYYESIKEAAIAYNLSHRNLARYLNGTRKNKTSFIFI